MNTIWLISAIGFAFAAAGKHQPAALLSGLPWWHRVPGTAAAAAFYGTLGPDRKVSQGPICP
jgi:hypothetical protein